VCGKNAEKYLVSAPNYELIAQIIAVSNSTRQCGVGGEMHHRTVSATTAAMANSDNPVLKVVLCVKKCCSAKILYSLTEYGMPVEW
jgi:hypothetical protein